MVNLEILEQQGLVPRGLKVNRAVRVSQEEKEKLESLADPEHQVYLELKETEVKQVARVFQVAKGILVVLAMMVLLVYVGNQVMRDLEGLLAYVAQKENPV